MNTASQSYIEIDNVTYQFQSLDEFGFAANVDLTIGLRSQGLLTLGTDKLDVAFRVRENKAGTIKASFSNLSIADSETIQKYLRKQQRGFIEGGLESRSYDELAQGLTGAEPTFASANNVPEAALPSASMSSNQQQANSNGLTTNDSVEKMPLPGHDAFDSTNQNPGQVAAALPRTSDNVAPTVHSPASPANPSTSNVSDRSHADSNHAKSGIRSLAMLLMMFALIGLVVIAFYFLRSRSTLSVGHSALVGNYLPVNVKAEGEITDLLVAEGDQVKEGDLLMRLKNPAMQMEHEQYSAKLNTASSKVAAIKKQLKNTEKRVAIAGKKLALDLVVAKSEMTSADKLYEVANLNFERLKPALNSGAITETEFEVARQELLAAEANKLTTQNAAKQIEFAMESMKDNVLILGDRFDDEIGRLTAELEIAAAEQKEMQMALAVANQQFENLNVRAPRDGTVYVTYRQVGEYVKIADQTIGLSFEGKVWAAGQVSASQSRRVRPGQPVTITAPSLGRTFDGVVSAIGHRAMHSPGHYSADFRGETATDVPVKVIIQDLPEDVPSGIRLQMAINIGFGVDWLDRSMGYSLRSISDGRPVDNQVKKENSPGKPNIDIEGVGKVAADM